MLHELRLFFVALQFLTRVPVPAWVGYRPEWLHACVRHFPLVGACVGGFGAAVLWTALALFPPAVAVVLSMAATVWLTGGFHEDGFADTCDALGGAVSRERSLAIMKDSRIGSYAALGLALMLGLKAVTLTALLPERQPLLPGLAAMCWAHVVSRAAPVWLIRTLSYAGDLAHAKAKPLATQVSWSGVIVCSGWVAVAGAGLMAALGWAAALPIAGSVLTAASLTAAMARWLRQRLGGYTGDTLGATQQIVEVGVLLTWLALQQVFARPHIHG